MDGSKELDAIAAEGAALNTDPAAPTPGAQPEQSAPQQNPAQMWAVIPYTFGSIIAEAMPELRDCYSEERCLKWGEAMVPVAKKYGWDSLDALPELGLIAVSLAFIVPTGKAMMARRRAAAVQADKGKPADEKKPASEPGPAIGPNAGVV